MKDLSCSKLQIQTWLLPLSAVVWNQAVYYGAGQLAQGAYHHDWTLPIDWATPFVPWTVSVYFLCYLFWAVNYVLSARQKKMLAWSLYGPGRLLFLRCELDKTEIIITQRFKPCNLLELL